jgi:putative transposase
MPFKPSIHNRRSIRLRGYDYAAPGSYFVTIDTHRMKCLFGKIVNGVMRLNDYGEIARAEWLKTASIRPEIVLDEFQIMPNHIHAIVMIMDYDDFAGATRRVAPTTPADHPAATINRRVTPTDKSTTLVSRSIGAIMAQYKSIVSKRINRIRRTPGAKLWQRNYHDHIIRNDGELSRIRKYIRDNPMRWELDIKNQ